MENPRKSNMDRFLWKPGDIELVRRANPEPTEEEQKELESEKLKELRNKYRKGNNTHDR